LRLLKSLAEQEKAEPEEFEVWFNVNNSRKEALKKSAVYKTNRRMLVMLNQLSANQRRRLF